MPSVAYLGPPGTHTHRAARCLYTEECLKPFDATLALTQALDKGTVAGAVLPLENSIEGTVSATFDYLTSTSKMIIGEIVLSIEHVLATLEGKKIEDIKIIASHPQALAQCSNFINQLQCYTLPTVSTVAAIKELSYEKPTAVIVSAWAAELYKLEIIAQNIALSANNSTRFCILADKPAEPSGNDKTSIIFEIEDKPGSLYEILRQFAETNINLTKIESRPAKYRLGKYLFAIDFEGHVNDKQISQLLHEIERSCIFLKILGSYPKYVF